MERAFPLTRLGFASAAALLVAGCGAAPDPTPEALHKHQHTPPHGGTPVELGREEYHVELVRDPSAGRLTAYVMDGELEGFVRVPATALVMTAKVGGVGETLTLQPVANPATGEKVGDTSQFEGTADWLKTADTFDGSFQELAIKGRTFRDVRFNFPKGNE